MRMVYTRPTLAMVWLGAVCLLAGLLAARVLLLQPWLGVTLQISDSGDTVLVSNVAQHHGANLPLGVQVVRMTSASGESMALLPADLIEEPDFLDTYGEMNAFFDRQSALSALLHSSPVTLHWRTPQGVEGQTAIATTGTRMVSSLPFTFWFQLGVGFAVWLISGWVFVLRPDYWGARLFALTGLTFPFATTSAAIYSSRELALPGELFRTLSGINHAGAIFFGCALAGLFLMYPKPFVSPRKLLWLPAVFGGWWVVDVLQWAPDQNWGSRLPISLELGLSIIFGVLQWRGSRLDPLNRAALRWFALSSLVGCSLFILNVYLPSMLGWFSPLPQAYAFAFFLVMYIGIALGLRKYRLFDLDEWAYRILLWLAGAASVIVMDTVLLYWGLGQSASLGVTLLVCGSLYFPFRQWLWQRVLKRHATNIESLLPEITRIAFISHTDEQERAWTGLLQQLFNPLESLSSPGETAEAQVQGDGLALMVPRCARLPAYTLRYAGHGARLFSTRDAQFATSLCHLMGEMMSGRTRYEHGVTQERLRIGRDLHDNIGARLLKLIHQLRGTPTAEVARDAMKDLRTAIGALDAEPVPLPNALADWRAEAEGRCEVANCQLLWQQPAILPALVLAPRTKASLESAMRELFTNALKHASPSQIQVAISLEVARLRVSVSNNGHITGLLNWKEGYGLRNLRGRLEELGGQLGITADAHQVRVTLELMLT